MIAKIVLIQPEPMMAKVVLATREYEVDPVNLKAVIDEYYRSKNEPSPVEHYYESRTQQRHSWLCKEVERISELEDPQKELKELVVYLNTPIAVA